jgi:hypothetical protein
MRSLSSSAFTRRRTLAIGNAPEPESDVLNDGQMGKEGELLKDVADTPFANREIDALRDCRRRPHSPNLMSPRSGRMRPAMESRIVLLPEPEGPKSIVTPGVHRMQPRP